MLLPLAMLFCISFSLQADNPLQEAWQKLDEAQIFEAIDLFEKAAKQKAYEEEANLMLALLYQRVDRIEDATKRFAEYYKIAENPIPTSYALMYDECVINVQGYKKDYNVKIHDMLMEDPRAKGKTLTSLKYNKALDVIVKLQEDKAKALFQEINELNEWAFVGPFDNVMNNGYNKNFNAIEKPQDDAVFETRYGAPVSWFTSEIDKNDGYQTLVSIFRDQNMQVYAQTFVELEETKDVIINLAYSGSLKLWLNDHEIYTNREVRATAADEYQFKTTIPKGNNRILVQIGDYKTGSPNFMLRITDRAFNSIDLKNSSSYKPYNSNKPEIEMVEHYAHKYFKAKLNQNPKDRLSLLLLARAYKKRKDYNQAELYYKKFEEISPLNYFLLRDLILLYSESGNSSEQTKYYEIFEAKYPEDKDAMENKLEEYAEQSKNDLIIETSKRYMELFPSPMSQMNGKVRIQAIEEDYMGIIKSMDDMYKIESDNPEIVLGQYNVVKSMGGEDKAIEILETANKKFLHGSITGILTRYYTEKGEYDKAIKLQERIIDLSNGDHHYLKKIANIYSQKKEFGKAIDIMNELIKNRPTDYNLYEEIASLHNFAGNKKKVTENYKKSLSYYPFDFKLNEKLREARGDKGLLSYIETPKPDEIIEKYEKEQTPDLSKSYEIAFHNITMIENEWNARAKQESYLIKINKEEAIEEWQRVNLTNSYGNQITTNDVQIIKKNGNVVSAERNGNDYVFVNLEAGDYIYVSYVESMIYGGKSSKFFYEDYGFDAYVPAYYRSFVFMSEKENSIKYSSVNMDLEPKIGKKGSLKSYEWSTESKLLKPEDNSLAYGDLAQKVVISSNHSWNDIVQWYRDLSNQQAGEDYTITKLVDELKLKEIDSDIGKAKKIYDFILQNIQYSYLDFRQSGQTPQRASEVYHTRLGDCKDVSTLFAAIGRAAGLDVDLVLINTSDNGEKEVILPSTNFNHCIVKLKTQEEDLYLELTDPFLPFGHLYVTHDNANILDIPFDPSEKSTLKRLSYNKGYKNTIKRKSKIIVTPDDVLKISNKGIKTGNAAASLSETYLNISEEEQLDIIKRSFSNDFSGPVKMVDIDFSKLKQRSPLADYSYSFEVTSELLKVGSFKSFRVPLTDMLAHINSFQLEERTQAFNFKYYEISDSYEEDLEIMIEGDRMFLETPENVSLEYKGIKYDLNFEMINKNQINVRRTYYPQKINISTEDYPEFRAFILKIIEAEKSHLVIK